MLLILEMPTDDDQWQLIGTADDLDQADAMTQDRRGRFLLVDPDQLSVSAFQRILKREDLAPAASPTRASTTR